MATAKVHPASPDPFPAVLTMLASCARTRPYGPEFNAFVDGRRREEAEYDAEFLRGCPQEGRDLATLIGADGACRVLGLLLFFNQIDSRGDLTRITERSSLMVKRDLLRVAKLAADLGALVYQKDVEWHLESAAKTKLRIAAGRAYYDEQVQQIGRSMATLAELSRAAAESILVRRGPKRDAETYIFLVAARSALRREGVRHADGENSIMVRSIRMVYQCFGRDPELVRDQLRSLKGAGIMAALPLLHVQMHAMRKGARNPPPGGNRRAQARK